MKLSKSIAQKIVKEMMNVIPYNINVMDQNGKIIGSGDIERIGSIHLGAIKAIGERHSNEVFDFEEGMKPGINEPIILNGNVVGVVGITGHPDEVRKFGKLVSVTAALLIEQNSVNEKEQNARVNREKFYHELSHRKDVYDEEFIKRAKGYGIDISKKGTAILVDGDVNSKAFLNLCNKYSHFCYLENNKIVFFTTDNYNFNKLINELEKSNEINNVGVGGENEIFATSLEQAIMAIDFGLKIRPCVKVYNYEDVKFLIHLSYAHKESLVAVISNLNKSGNKLELIRTIQVYINENGDINSIANKLNIHRNTLNYRLERVEQLTGKSPKILTELFELMCGIIWS